MTMKFKVSRADMWLATIEDEPGGAARVLAPVAKAGANFARELTYVTRISKVTAKTLGRRRGQLCHI